MASAPAAGARSTAASRPQGVFNVQDFGAAATGQVLDTKPLQSAIDAAAQSGGVVYFPPGTYLSGTLTLNSHVSLHLEAAAVLLGSTNLADYPRIQPALRSYTETYTNQSLIYGENLEGVSLLGRGTLNGQGASFKRVQRYGNRPYMIRMVNCRHVQVADLTLLDSPMWVQHYLACEDVSIQGLTVHSHCNTNNDGIDIDACEKVRISGCEISSGDDALVLKSTLDRPCRDVTVTNCVLSSECNALKIGTESVGGFQNIAITNCTVYDTLAAGISLESVDGAALENVTVSNIVMRNVKCPIFLRLGNRARPVYEGAPTPGLGSFRNVMISDIQATGRDAVGCAIAGLPEPAIENVTLANIRIQFQGGGTLADASREVPELPAHYPEYDMFGVLPASGFYCRHVKNLRLVNTQVAFAHEDLRPALVCEDVAGLRISDFAAPNTNPVMVLRGTRDAWVEGNRAPQGNQVYLRLEGPHTENVSIAANDLRASSKPLDLGPGVRPETVLVSPPLQPYRGE
ncbi:MAG TPA: glycoside hydrolase family 28 protein [Terriglobia bacterium]|nr:glycoside hydrolase family 28 protein [Terriglobia bacterium]